MGSYYDIPFSGENIFNATSSEDLIRANEYLPNVKSVGVVGAGSVGVEVVGEILTKFPSIKLKVISSSEKFLERTVPIADVFIRRFLLNYPSQVELYMGHRIASYENNIVTTNQGTEIVIFPLFQSIVTSVSFLF